MVFSNRTTYPMMLAARWKLRCENFGSYANDVRVKIVLLFWLRRQQDDVDIASFLMVLLYKQNGLGLESFQCACVRRFLGLETSMSSAMIFLAKYQVKVFVVTKKESLLLNFNNCWLIWSLNLDIGSHILPHLWVVIKFRPIKWQDLFVINLNTVVYSLSQWVYDLVSIQGGPLLPTIKIHLVSLLLLYIYYTRSMFLSGFAPSIATSCWWWSSVFFSPSLPPQVHSPKCCNSPVTTTTTSPDFLSVINFISYHHPSKWTQQ